jgi:hypothetical protein
MKSTFWSVMWVVGFATLSAIHVLPAQGAAPVEAWPWGAQVDESMFAAGGTGVTIHAAPTGTGDGDGSIAKPYDLPKAMKVAAETMRSMESTYVESPDAVAFPLWLRLARTGDAFTAYTAADTDGKPGNWTQVGEPRQVTMGEAAWVGFLVNSADMWPPKQTAATATFDRVLLNGKPVDAADWSVRRLGNTNGRNEATIDGQTITIHGNGVENRWRGPRNFADAGQAVLTQAKGNFEVVARLASLELPDGRPNANVMLIVRQDDPDRIRVKQGAFSTSAAHLVDHSSAARMAQVQVTAHRENKDAPIAFKAYAAWRADLPKEGRDARVVLLPGTYRLTSGLDYPDRDLIARAKTFVIEGQRGAGDAAVGNVVISGSAVAGWEPATWTRQPDGSYSHAWTQTWGGDKLVDRHEMISLTPASGPRVRLRQVMAAEFKAEPGTFAVDESKNSVQLALPSEITADAFASGALVEVAQLKGHLLSRGVMDSSGSIGDNVVFRNLVFEHSAETAVQLHWWPEPHYATRGLLLEDVTFRENAREGFRINHVRDFTFRRVSSSDNGVGNHMIAAEGQIVDSTFSRNGWRRECEVIWNAWRNVLVRDSRFDDNHGIPVRNDHVAENVLIDRCGFARNRAAVLIFETVIGPVTVRDSTFVDNDPGTKPDQDGIIGLAAVSNVSIERCTFTNNKRGVISSYPRERAHVANEAGNDELCNNLDVGHWDTDNTADGRTTPGGKKGQNGNRNMSITDSTFTATGPQDYFLIQHHWQRPDAYRRTIRQDWRAWNNRYYNPNNPNAFELGTNVTWGEHVYGTFEQWKAVSTLPNFEAGSAWGEIAPRDFVPAKPTLATPGTNAKGTAIAGGRLRYETEALPFTANRPVELLRVAKASGGKLHKLISEQVGEYGGHVTYTLEVPADGDYYVDLHYLQTSGAFQYLGYAQLSIDGKPVGPAFDQDGLTTTMMAVPMGPVRLTTGPHAFRVEAVWRNGYNSGDYDVTIDAIELSTSLDLRPATAAGVTTPGLTYELFEGNWDRLPDFAKLTPSGMGIAGRGPDVAVSVEEDDIAIRFGGFITVPANGIYTFDTTVNDGANLYVGDKLVVDNDGVHDGEKDEPWRKSGFVALRAGAHPVRIDYFNRAGGHGRALAVHYAGPGVNYQPVPVTAWSHRSTGGPAAAALTPINVLPRIRANDDGSPRGWTTEAWNAPKVRVVTEGDPAKASGRIDPTVSPGPDVRFIRVVAPDAGNTFAGRDVEVDPSWTALHLSAWVRVKDLTRGDAVWKTARLTLEPKGAEQVVASIDADTAGWRRVELSLPLKPGTPSVRVALGFLYSAGTLDVANPTVTATTR